MQRFLRIRRTLAVPLAAITAATGAVALSLTVAATPAQAADNGLAPKPYMGWSSWSQQSSKYPGLNPNGDYSYLNEANVIKQADYMAANLKQYGYDRINMDAGWWSAWDWTPGYDGNGRQTANLTRFPRGMKWMIDYIHGKGLKAGLYLPVGLEKASYDKGDLPIAGAPGCTTHQIVYSDLRSTNGWDSSYKIDYSKPCAQKYVDSLGRMLADLGADFLKFDGVGPGSGKNDSNHDNRPDVQAMSQALISSGRDIVFEISAWPLDYSGIATWEKYANAWRAHTDVECYCSTLVTWDNSVKARFDAGTAQWLNHVKPGGWVDFDSINVGNGQMDGINQTERQTYMTLWAIAAAPLYIGDDLTKLDAYGLSLLTNTEVIAQNQAGIPARPRQPGASQQTWVAKNADGTYTIGLFNLGGSTTNVTVTWGDLGFGNASNVRDMWTRTDLGTQATGFTATLPAHGSRLIRVTPGGTPPTGTSFEAENATRTGNAVVVGCPACSGGAKVGNFYANSTIQSTINAPTAGTYNLTLAYTAGDNSRTATITINGTGTQTLQFTSTGGWNTPGTKTITANLQTGNNTITLDSGTGYGPDLDKITVTS
ncbi:alpha-galactosidase D [Nonomuraea sp. NPDC050556]|uniref:alpha-galactosidase D n=1 Tax=Nonomuraea sp. NPDC050556 TaxID=3364369 RepID=UPI0037AD6342